MDQRPESIKVYLARLTEGEVEPIEETLSPESLLPHEEGLRFSRPVKVRGEAYLARSVLVVSMQVETEAVLPCRVCGGDVKVEVCAQEAYNLEEVAEHRDGVVDLVPMVRELVFLNLPTWVECEGGCSEREELSRYLRKEKGNEEYHPFADL